MSQLAPDFFAFTGKPPNANPTHAKTNYPPSAEQTARMSQLALRFFSFYNKIKNKELTQMCRELLETYGIKAVTMLLEFDDESPQIGRAHV